MAVDVEMVTEQKVMIAVMSPESLPPRLWEGWPVDRAPTPAALGRLEALGYEPSWSSGAEVMAELRGLVARGILPGCKRLARILGWSFEGLRQILRGAYCPSFCRLVDLVGRLAARFPECRRLRLSLAWVGRVGSPTEPALIRPDTGDTADSGDRSTNQHSPVGSRRDVAPSTSRGDQSREEGVYRDPSAHREGSGGVYRDPSAHPEGSGGVYRDRSEQGDLRSGVYHPVTAHPEGVYRPEFAPTGGNRGGYRSVTAPGSREKGVYQTKTERGEGSRGVYQTKTEPGHRAAKRAKKIQKKACTPAKTRASSTTGTFTVEVRRDDTAAIYTQRFSDFESVLRTVRELRSLGVGSQYIYVDGWSCPEAGATSRRAEIVDKPSPEPRSWLAELTENVGFPDLLRFALTFLQEIQRHATIVEKRHGSGD